MSARLVTEYEDFPNVLPIFPIPNIVLLPGARLPLNVFEPRYMALVEDSLKNGRLFGMVQPVRDEEAEDALQELYSVGTVGRVVHFSETENDNYVIVLLGICRFRTIGELEPDEKGYRRFQVDYGQYKHDVDSPMGEQTFAPRARLVDCLNRYVKAHDLDVDVRDLESLSLPSLVVTLSMALPFEASEKQALLESPTIDHRYSALCTLMEMGAMTASGMGDAPQ